MPAAYYRFEANVIGRSSAKQSSRSVVFAAAYRAGERLNFEREGVEADYTARTGILETGILTPKNAPEWTNDRGQLWNRVEATEKRKDAQLARELLIAFPHELQPDQQHGALLEFLSEHVVERGMIADFAIHAPGRHGDERNKHAHVLLTMRPIADNGFGNKERDWNSPDLLKKWREEWANTLNRTFERHGVKDAAGETLKVDHRSYEDQGLEKEPGVHLGPAAAALERRGIQTERGDINRAAYGRNAELAFLKRQAALITAEVLQLQEGIGPVPRRAHKSLTFIEDVNTHEAQNENEPEPGF
jgi:ATP-dependent exoDNAse (exonuclease V) alpha subunit